MAGSNKFQLNFGDVKGRWGPVEGQGANATAAAPAQAQAEDDFDLLGSAATQSASQGVGGFNFGAPVGSTQPVQQGNGAWGVGAVHQQAGPKGGSMGGMGNPAGYNTHQMHMQGGMSGQHASRFPQQGMQTGGFQQAGQQAPHGFGGADPFASHSQGSGPSSNASSPVRRIATGRTLADGASLGASAASKSAAPAGASGSNRLAGLATGDLSAFDIHAGGETRKLAAKTADAKRSVVPVDTRSRGAALAFGGGAPSGPTGGTAAQSVTAAHKAHLDSSLSNLLPGNFKKGGGGSFMSGGGSAPPSTKSGGRSVRAGASMAELAKTSAAKSTGHTPVMSPPGGLSFAGQGGQQVANYHQQQQQQGGFGFGAPAQHSAAGGFNFN